MGGGWRYICCTAPSGQDHFAQSFLTSTFSKIVTTYTIEISFIHGTLSSKQFVDGDSTIADSAIELEFSISDLKHLYGTLC